MKKAGLCAATVLVSLAVAAPAQADTLRLRGSLVGNPAATVSLGAKKKHGDIKRVTGITFKHVPVTCADGSGGEIQGSLVGFGVRGKDFTRKGPIRGIGINDGFLRVAGKFSRGGRVAKGKVRFAFKNDAGAGCGTDDVAWKATR